MYQIEHETLGIFQGIVENKPLFFNKDNSNELNFKYSIFPFYTDLEITRGAIVITSHSDIKMEELLVNSFDEPTNLLLISTKGYVIYSPELFEKY